MYGKILKQTQHHHQSLRSKISRVSGRCTFEVVYAGANTCFTASLRYLKYSEPLQSILALDMWHYAKMGPRQKQQHHYTRWSEHAMARCHSTIVSYISPTLRPPNQSFQSLTLHVSQSMPTPDSNFAPPASRCTTAGP